MTSQGNCSKAVGQLANVVKILLITFVIAGCAGPTGNFSTRRDPASTTQIKRIILFYGNADGTDHALGRGFADKFLAIAAEQLRTKGVVVETLNANTKFVDDTAQLFATAKTFKPTEVLSVGLTSVRNRTNIRRMSVMDMPRYDYVSTVTFGFRMTATPSGATLWRGQVEYAAMPDGETVAQQFVARLAAEKFL